MDAVAIATSALDVEWRRVEITAQNLANLNTTHTANGEVYRPLHLSSGPMPGFQSLLDAQGVTLSPRGVAVTAVEPDANGLRRAFEPNNPDADADGFVTYPNIDNAAEMTTLIRASRAYEANLAAISIAVGMYGKAMEIGR
ncbi:MAG: flagellar basal body rod protein FlgC [Terricaulis sp.]